MHFYDFTDATYLKPPTRQLMLLLADETTGRIIAALRADPQTAPQLESLADSSQKKVADALNLLEAHGIIEGAPHNTTAKGRPARRWRLATPDELAEFERTCDSFKERMLRHQLAGYGED